MTKRKKLIKELDGIFSIYIRKRDADDNGNVLCCTCNKVEHWKKMDCGHFQSRKHKSTRWDEINAHVQCKGCNIFKNGEQYKHAIFINKRYGKGTAELLQKAANEVRKWDIIELEEMIEYYKNKI